jgi:hypothetical protein
MKFHKVHGTQKNQERCIAGLIKAEGAPNIISDDLVNFNKTEANIVSLEIVTLIVMIYKSTEHFIPKLH